jgi:hypothetical protein
LRVNCLRRGDIQTKTSAWLELLIAFSRAELLDIEHSLSLNLEEAANEALKLNVVTCMQIDLLALLVLVLNKTAVAVKGFLRQHDAEVL